MIISALCAASLRLNYLPAGQDLLQLCFWFWEAIHEVQTFVNNCNGIWLFFATWVDGQVDLLWRRERPLEECSWTDSILFPLISQSSFVSIILGGCLCRYIWQIWRIHLRGVSYTCAILEVYVSYWFEGPTNNIGNILYLHCSMLG